MNEKKANENMSYDHGNNEPAGGSNAQSAFSSTGSASGSKKVNADLFTCSLCGHSFDRALTKTMPFCSTRCQQIDLGRWMNESYGLPNEGNAGPEGFDIPTDDE